MVLLNIIWIVVNFTCAEEVLLHQCSVKGKQEVLSDIGVGVRALTIKSLPSSDWIFAVNTYFDFGVVTVGNIGLFCSFDRVLSSSKANFDFGSFGRYGGLKREAIYTKHSTGDTTIALSTGVIEVVSADSQIMPPTSLPGTSGTIKIPRNTKILLTKATLKGDFFPMLDRGVGTELLGGRTSEDMGIKVSGSTLVISLEKSFYLTKSKDEYEHNVFWSVGAAFGFDYSIFEVGFSKDIITKSQDGSYVGYWDKNVSSDTLIGVILRAKVIYKSSAVGFNVSAMYQFIRDTKVILRSSGVLNEDGEFAIGPCGLASLSLSRAQYITMVFKGFYIMPIEFNDNINLATTFIIKVTPRVLRNKQGSLLDSPFNVFGTSQIDSYFSLGFGFSMYYFK